MLANPNRFFLRRLSKQLYRSRRSRNRVVITATALTTALFTLVFTIGISLIDSLEQETMRMVGTTAHGGAGNMTFEEWEKVSKHSDIKQFGTRVIVGTAENPELNKRANTQIQYEDKNYAKWGFHSPVEGHLPERENEIMADSKTLELLGVKKKIGETLIVEFTLKGESVRKDFVLSGYFDPDEGAAYDIGIFIVSKAFIDGYLSNFDVAEDRKYVTPAIGSYDISFMLSNSLNLETKVEQIVVDSLGQSYRPVNLNVNWAYLGNNIFDPTSLMLGVIALGMIFSAGFLIIYNIFRISIVQDIRFYGMFKTIGATSSQLKSLLLRQAMMFSWRGIPAGLIPGFVLGGVFLPLIEAQLSVSRIDLSFNPLILVSASLFSLFTVYCGTIRSCRKAGNVSPMEALRYQSIQGSGRVKRKTGRSRISSLAWHNIFRFKGKTFNVTISLALSVIVLLTIVSYVGSFDAEQYVSLMTPSDFSVGDASLFDVDGRVGDRRAELDRVMASVNKQFDLIEDELVYYREESVILEGAALNRFTESIRNEIETGEIIEEAVPFFEKMIVEETMTLQLYGIGKIALNSLSVCDGEIDPEKWASGDYAVSGGFRDIILQPGDKVLLTGVTGDTREYTIMANVDGRISDSLGIGYSMGHAEQFFIPGEEYTALFEDLPIKYAFNANSNELPAIETFLSEYTQKVEPTMNYTSRYKAMEEYKGFIRLFSVIGGCLSGIIALIGLMNLINTLYTGIVSRRRELAGLQAVGMTKRQLTRMLNIEGLFYGLISLLWVIFPGIPLSIFLSSGLGKEIWFYSAHFPFGVLLVALPLILLVSGFLPCLVLKKSDKLTITEALRQSEF